MGGAPRPRQRQHHTRVSLGGLALRGIPRGGPPGQCFCEVRFVGTRLPVHLVPLEVLGPSAPDPDSLATSATFYLSPEDLEGGSSGDLLHSFKKRQLEISVVVPRPSCGCSGYQEQAVGTLRVPITQQWSQGYPHFQPVRGWSSLGGRLRGGSPAGLQLHLCVTVEPDPRQLFDFVGPVALSPQVVHVDGPRRQPVFSCKFRSDGAGQRSSRSGSSGSWSGPLPAVPSPGKEVKGWTVTVHDLSGAPAAAASIVTPFVSSRATGKVSEENPGAWLIMRPEGPEAPMQPWARLEAWREQGGNGVACRFELIGDEAVAADGTMGSVVCRGRLSVRHGGDFSLHAVVPRARHRPREAQGAGEGAEDMPEGSAPARDRRSHAWSCAGFTEAATSTAHDPQPKGAHHRTPKVQPLGRTSSVDLRDLEGLHSDEGFVMKLALRKGSQMSQTSLQVGRCHIRTLNDAAVFVALATAVELSVEACQSPSKVLRQVLQGDGGL